MATFPYTPGFVHGTTHAWAVDVQQFQNWTEQRYLRSRHRAVRLAYEFPFPTSALIAGVTSFYLAQGGPTTAFTAVDHRSGVSHQVRFAAPTLEHLIGPFAQRRSLKVEFVSDQGGTTPVPTTYVASAVADFCDAVVPTSGVVEDGTSNPGPWLFVGGPATVTPTARWLSLDGIGPTGTSRVDYEVGLPTNTRLNTLAFRVTDMGSAASVRVQILINSVVQPSLTATTSATFTTAVCTVTVALSANALVCLQTSLGTSLATGARLVWTVGYNNPS